MTMTWPPFLSISLYISVVLSACPDEDGTLKPWSKAASWPSGKVPQENEEIFLNFSVLLDTIPPELFAIEIQDGGRLVWSSNGDYSLRLRHILIKSGGEMHIGSEECQFERKAKITLLGEPDERDIPKLGEKFIGVLAGGTLELHGKDKRSWTKLTKTAPKYNSTHGEIYKHKDNSPIKMRGVYLYHFNTSVPENYDVINDKAVFVKGKIHRKIRYPSQDDVDAAVNELITFIDGIPTGDIFAIATLKNFRGSKNVSALYNALDDLGATTFRSATNNDAYVAIGIKGNKSSVLERLGGDSSGGVDYNEASITYAIPDIEREIVVISYNHHVKEYQSHTEFNIINTYLTRPVISVFDDVMNDWSVGDKIFITSTDYKWDQVEDFTIIDCPTCPPKSIRLDHHLRFSHYGEIFKRVDMRAEVGLKTRYIHITSEVSEGKSNGGHVKGFKRVAVEGTELTNLGDPLKLGRYPLHYHMCFDLANRTLYPTPSYIRRNSIHHTQFRCITIHGTQSAVIADNVCYDCVGHGFFVEDGGERNLTFYRNLGLGQRHFEGAPIIGVTGAIPSDKDKGPATYWITNPLTTMVNNVAAGGQGIGFWYVYPVAPVGPSADKNFMQPGEARNTKITMFLNNSCHSYETCFFIDNEMDENFTVGGYNRYHPRMNPLDPTSPRVPAVFEGLTASKCTRQNLWIRSSPVIVKRASLSDSPFGAFLLREVAVWQIFEDSVIIGLSDNVGENLIFRNKDTIGFRFSKGPIVLKNTWFGSFESSSERISTAIGNQQCMNHNDPRNSLDNVMFDFDDGPGKRFMFQNCTSRSPDMDSIFALRDNKKAMTDDDVTIVTNKPFLLTGKCKIRSGWNAAYCPHVYGKIFVSYEDRFNIDMNVYRTDGVYPNLPSVHMDEEKQFLPILGGSHNYLVKIHGAVPSVVTFDAETITKSKYALIALCVPREADIEFEYRMKDQIKRKVRAVNSRQEVVDDYTVGTYYYDKVTGVIFFKMIHELEYETDEISPCPSNICPRGRVRVKSGNLTDSDCVSRFATVQEYMQVSTGTAVHDTSTLRATSADPPETIGHGATYPF